MWLRDCFGLKPNIRNYLGKITFVLSIVCFCLALLDFRGYEEQVDTPLSDQLSSLIPRQVCWLRMFSQTGLSER